MGGGNTAKKPGKKRERNGGNLYAESDATERGATRVSVSLSFFVYRTHCCIVMIP